MNYRSIADMNDTIFRGLAKIPWDIDIVVGIPRSGLLAASILALHRNLPMTDLSGLIEGRLTACGTTRGKGDLGDFLSKKRKAIIIDDSVYYGVQMKNAKERLANAGMIHDLVYAAVYVRPEQRHDVDIALEFVATPRIFEWNMMHHDLLKKTCVDLDGVLCRDPTEEENDDGERYRRFLSNADPLLIPTLPIGWIVSCRLEKYRSLTEQWLKEHGVQYGELLMLDLPDKAARVAAAPYASFKASVYRSTGAMLFMESSLSQAVEIARLTRKDVLCLENREMIQGPLWARKFREMRQAPRSFFRRAKNFLKGFVKRHSGGTGRHR